MQPGDKVEVMNGTYTAPFYGDALDITTSGTASAPITFEAAPGATPVIDSSGGWNAIKVTASYITIKGFTVVGDAAKYTLSSALAGYSTGSSQLDGNGIVVVSSSGVPLPNHVTIENNTVYNEPGGGIDTGGSDYVQILNNVVHNNGNWSAFGCSGISITTSQNLDLVGGPHIIVSGNLVYDNAQLVPTDGAGAILDGEGIILDTNPNYTNEILVENNTVYDNGSSGVTSFLTNGAVITGNTVFGNDTGHVQPASDAQILINQSNHVTVTGNTTTPPNAAGAIDTLTPDQRLEAIYLGYFGRGADSGGFAFWEQQYAAAIASGQTPGQAIVNIANSFAPQSETTALYPALLDLSQPLDPNSVSAQNAVTAFVNSVYENVFNRPLASGDAYWVNQILNNQATLGQAILFIENGAIGSDVTTLDNKIAVASSFTNQTSEAALGLGTPSASYLAEAHSVVLGTTRATSGPGSVATQEAAITSYVTTASEAGSTVTDRQARRIPPPRTWST